MMVAGVAAAVTVDPIGRTVSSSAFAVQFSTTNPEEITSLSWNGSANLTATGVNLCGDPLEYFGNSWAAPDSGDFKSLVGWGQSGTFAATSKGASIASASESSSGCYGAIDIPITTKYHFWDSGPAANRIKVDRGFDFRGSGFNQDFRPYIPRLYPMDGFSQVYYPDATGTALLSTPSVACPFGCQIGDWNDSWFAMHDPLTGNGLIVRQAPTAFDTDLWVDEDAASFTNSTGVLILSPPGGFTDKVQTNTFLCFYDSGIWAPALTLPPGC
jgi:hypothetical protein